MLELKGISKSYGGARALIDASVSIGSGLIHGLIGPNGAGKSTLVKIATGQVGPDEGVIEISGVGVRFSRPSDAHKNGIVAVAQELTLVPELSVAENIVLGREPKRGPFLLPEHRREAASAALDRLGIRLPVDMPVGRLQPSLQRLVMLAQALHRRARVLFLDEPTAAMSSAQADLVLEIVGTLRDQGVAVVYVTHRLDEVVRLCDRVTVIRDGRIIETIDRDDITEDRLVEAVVGGGRLLEAPPRGDGHGDIILEARDLRGHELRSVDLIARKGEILGIAGIIGSGVRELLEMLVGAVRPRAGEIVIEGRRVSFHSPADALAAGISFLPAERSLAGFLGLSVRSNVVVSHLPQIARKGLTTVRSEKKAAAAALRSVGVAPRTEEPLSALSGGNQQRTLVARALLAQSSVLVLDDPTAGVDAGARAELHNLLRGLANEGRLVIVSSSEPEELASLADRVLVLNRGYVKAVLAGEELTPARVVEATIAGTSNGGGIA